MDNLCIVQFLERLYIDLVEFVFFLNMFHFLCKQTITLYVQNGMLFVLDS